MKQVVSAPGTRTLHRASPGWAACRVQSRKGYRQAAWNEANRGSDECGADGASDRVTGRIRSRRVGYFDTITNNYHSSTAGNHRISGLGSNSPNTPNRLSPYLLPIKKEQAAPLRPSLPGHVASLAVGGSFSDEPAGIHGGTVDLAGQSSAEALQAPRQERTPSWQPMQS